MTASPSCMPNLIASFFYLLLFHPLNIISGFSVPRSLSSLTTRTAAFRKTTRTHFLLTMSSSSSPSSTTSLIECTSEAASQSLKRPVQFEMTKGGGYSGGGGASTYALLDTLTQTRYFCKTAMGQYNMLLGEYTGVKEMADTKTIRVPNPICVGEYQPQRQAFVIFEYLEFCGGGSQREMGIQLAKMHKCTSPNGQFGFHVDNTIGATPQPNMPWHDDWANFWDEHRLGHMLQLTGQAGYSSDKIQALRDKTRQLLSHHRPQPSLLHGDLWGGNKAFCRDGPTGEVVVPVIFDPATYYGDREADIAMTYLFGGFTNEFYQGYESEWPLPPGHEQRRTVYNLYHILNHEVLFGGGYLGQARGMMEQILRY